MKELLDKALDYAGKNAKWAEARYIEVESTGLSYRNGQFDGIDSGKESGIAVRVLNESYSSAYFDTTDWEKARDFIDDAIARSKFPGKKFMGTIREDKASWKITQRRPVKDFPLEEKLEIVRDSDRIMESEGASMRINFLGDKIINGTYLNSTGANISWETARIQYFYMFGVGSGDKFEQSTGQYGASKGYEYMKELNLDEIVKSEVSVLRKSAEAHRPEPGTYDFVIGPEISGIVAHESCGHPTEYDRIIGREGSQAGESFLTGKEFPFRIGSDAVSVIDDPTIPGSYGYYQYDDEGVRARKRYLYRNGMTSEFIHNRESAASLSTEPNGGGRSSSWDMEPLPRMSTTYIEPGKYEVDELFEGIEKGIYMKSFTEWNIDDIRYNEKYVGKEAYLIENGKITDVVRRPVIETNTISFYSSVDAVAKDLKFYAATCGKGDPEQGCDVWMGGPHVRLRNIRIQ